MSKLKSFFKNKSAIIGVCILLMALIGTASIGAYFMAADQQINETHIGYNEIKIVEEFTPPENITAGSEIPKDVKVTNIGPSACFVRVMAVFSDSTMGQYCTVDWNTTDWTYNSKDEYWYYNKAIAKGETTTSLFTKVIIGSDASDVKDFNMIVYAESYQSYGYTDYSKAWAAYQVNKPINEITIAFAVYSETDNTLTFYKRSDMPDVGDTYNGKTATAVYTGFEETAYANDSQVPWTDEAYYVKSVVFADEIKPISCAYWFYYFVNCNTMDLTKLNTVNATSFRDMFYYCSSLKTLDLSSWNTSSCTHMLYMFEYCKGLTSVKFGTNWNTAKVEYFTGMFYYCEALESLDLTGWNLSSASTIGRMFMYCKNIKTINLAGWNVSNLKKIEELFYGCEKLTTIYTSNSWTNLPNLTSSANMFRNCYSLVGGAGTPFDSSIYVDYSTIDKGYAIIDGGTSSPGYFTYRAA